MTRFFRCFALAALAICLAGQAKAHPHVWVTMKSEMVYAADGTATGVRHSWTFDDLFSTFATQGLESKEKGKFTREELAPLAQVNIESMKEFDYFTMARQNGKKVEFDTPKDYWLDFNEGLLTLNFTLPFKTPVKAKSTDLEIYDSLYFVDFSFATDKEPVKLVGAPGECKLNFARPGESAQKSAPGEAFFNNLQPGTNFGAQFANRISVQCP